MPSGGGDPAIQSIAIQMRQFHPGRSPTPGAFGRQVAGLAQSLAFLLLGIPALAVDPPVSPSIEADAEYLLTTTDFMDAQFGMAVTATSADADRILVQTTGAEFAFDPADGRLVVRQRLGRVREVTRVTFLPGVLVGLQVERQGTGAVLLRNGAGTLKLRINGDSLMMLQSERALDVRCELDFSPANVRSFQGDRVMLDEWGFVGTYFATGHGQALDRIAERAVESSIARGQVWWLAVGPPRPYPWTESLTESVAWHWSMETGYPTDAQIEQWSKRASILLQQAEVMLWKDWSLRFIPRTGLAEFQRVNRTCERVGMRNIVYTSPCFFLQGTGLEAKAMNSFDNFAVTGFSPGDDRGLNWPIFLSEITKVVKEYQPDGLYFDGIYGNLVRTYLLSRKARELVGDRGLLEYHATVTPPGGGGVYLPQIDTYYTFILRGEGAQSAYTDPDYLRYFVSTYNISNSIGVLCNNNDYPLGEEYVNTLLDNNIRLHYLLGGPDDQRTQGMEKYYWPALKPDLQRRVEAQRETRQAEFLAARRETDRIMSSQMPDVPVAWQDDFRDPALSLKLPVPAPEQGLEAALPGGWRGFLSPHGEATMAGGEGSLRVESRGNTVAYLDRDLPANTIAVQCRMRADGEFGMSWGPGMVLWVGNAHTRVGLRTDDRLQTDRAGEQILYDSYPVGKWYWLRLRLEGAYVLSEVSLDGAAWNLLRVDRLGDVGGPKRLMVGKVPYDGSRTEFTDPGGTGRCEVAEVKVFAAAK
jgi:hypothetical protein